MSNPFNLHAASSDDGTHSASESSDFLTDTSPPYAPASTNPFVPGRPARFAPSTQTIHPPSPPQDGHRKSYAGSIATAMSETLSQMGMNNSAEAALESAAVYVYDAPALLREAVTDANSSNTSAAFDLFNFFDEIIGKLLIERNNLRVANRQYDEGSEAMHAQIKNLRAKMQAEKDEADHRIALQATQIDAQHTVLQEIRNNRDFASASSSKKAIAKDPPAFDANEKDTAKRYTDYQNWRSKLMIRWVQDSHEFTSEIKKILHVAGLLSGQAYQAIQRGVDTVIDNQTDPDRWPWQTGAALIATLDKTYSNLDIIAEAEKRLALLEQKEEFKVFSDFSTEFQNLAERANLDDASRVRLFLAKINNRLSKALINQIDQPDRSDWPGWLAMLTKLNANIEKHEFQTKLNGNKPNGNGGGRPNGNGGGKPKDPDAMDLSAATVKVSPAEMQYRMDNGLCKRCGTVGHIAMNCTPAHRAAAPSPGSFRGGGSRGAPRGGSRGSYRGGAAPQWSSNNPYQNNGGGRGYSQPWQAQQQEYPQPYGAPRGGYQGQQVRAFNTHRHDDRGCHPVPFAHDQQYPTGFVEGEVDDTTVHDDQGKEDPLR